MRLFGSLVLATFALGLATCSPGEARKPTFPVSGKVVLPDGQPAENAQVVFHPASGADAGVPKPHGKVGADGTYKLTTYDTNDGAPAGEYRVTVELWLAGRGDEAASNRLNLRYSKPETAKLPASVGTGPTDLKPIELKR